MRARAFVLGIIASAAMALPVHATVQRSFVASYGNDANTAANCSFLNPCRGFAAAQTVTTAGGEIVALDAAGYGVITIDRSITITANPGFYAGIAAGAGTNGVTIATASVNVTLRGLNINGVGGINGISMTNGNRLSIENCVVSNFGTTGLIVNAPATVRVVDSIFRDNGNNGLQFDGGVMASVSGTKVLGNGNRGIILDVLGATDNYLSVSDSQVAGNFVAVQGAAELAGGTARVTIIRSSLTNNSYGPTSTAVPSSTTVVSVSSTLISGNLSASTYQSGPATLESLGNNTIRHNGAPTGSVTTVPQS